MYFVVVLSNPSKPNKKQSHDKKKHTHTHKKQSKYILYM